MHDVKDTENKYKGEEKVWGWPENADSTECLSDDGVQGKRVLLVMLLHPALSSD